MGFNDIPGDTYGDPEVDIIIDKVCYDAACRLPGCARNCEKFTGQMFELKLKLANFGPYTAGGFDLDKFRNELGCECITGLLCNGSWDPYGCKVVPWGCELVLCVPTDPDELGNCASEEDIPVVDFTEAKLQVWKDGAEVEDGWVAPDDCFAWVVVWAK